MIGKKDTKSIFEQYRQVLREQVEDNNINALLNAIKNSNLDEKTRNSLVNLLKDPEVASKWKGGDEGTVNAGDPNFAKEMAAAQKAQNLAYPEQNEEYLDQDEEGVDCSKITDPREKSNCIARRNMTIQQSMANAGKGEAPPQRVAFGRSY